MKLKILLAGLVLSLIAEGSRSLTQIELDLDSLREWGTKVYAFKSDQDPGIRGKLSLTTRFLDDTIVLDDVYHLTVSGKQVVLSTEIRSRRDNSLTPLRVVTKVETGGQVVADLQPGTGITEFDSAGATAEYGGKKRTMRGDFRGALTVNAFYRIVTLLPQQKGSKVSFTWLNLDGLILGQNHHIECLGEEGPKNEVKFVHTGRSISPQYAWVKDGILQRALTDNSKLLTLETSGSRAAIRPYTDFPSIFSWRKPPLRFKALNPGNFPSIILPRELWPSDCLPRDSKSIP